MIPLVTATQMRALDEETIAQLGIVGGVLMETAGRGVISVLLTCIAKAASTSAPPRFASSQVPATTAAMAW